MSGHWYIGSVWQRYSKYSTLESLPSPSVSHSGGAAGHSLLSSRTAQRVSLRTSAYRITEELALVIVIFHPVHS